MVFWFARKGSKATDLLPRLDTQKGKAQDIVPERHMLFGDLAANFAAKDVYLQAPSIFFFSRHTVQIS